MKGQETNLPYNTVPLFPWLQSLSCKYFLNFVTQQLQLSWEWSYVKQTRHFDISAILIQHFNSTIRRECKNGVRGHRSQKERERKRAASACQSIETLLSPKRSVTTSDSESASGKSHSTVDPNPSAGTSTVENQTDHLVQPLEPSCSADTTGGEDLVIATTSQEAECGCHSVDSGSEPVSGMAAIHDIGDIFVQAKSSSDFVENCSLCRHPKSITS